MVAEQLGSCDIQPTDGVRSAAFRLHTETDVRVTDTEGQEFSSFEDARCEAMQTCGKMMSDAADAFWGSRPWNVLVTDHSGLIIWEIYGDGQTSAVGRSLEPTRKSYVSMAPLSFKGAARQSPSFFAALVSAE